MCTIAIKPLFSHTKYKVAIYTQTLRKFSTVFSYYLATKIIYYYFTLDLVRL